jgi:hypothetical protein
MGNSENGKKCKNKISMDQFVDHFKNLISNDNVDNGPDTTDTMDNGTITLFTHNSGKRLVHNITLNSLHNIGIRIVFPSKIYSFKILFTVS